MRRGDLVTVALPGDMGKPRPVLVVQSDRFEATGTVTVLPVSGTWLDAPLIRLPLTPGEDIGLRKPSQVMIDKVTSVRRERIGQKIGRLDAAAMLEVTRSLAVFLGIG